MNNINYKPEEMVILIVDDVKTNLQLLTYILEQEGYQTSLASNGDEALEIFKILKPDLILLDLMMPEMSGLDVCEIIKSDSENSNIPIIFLTASQEEEHLVKAFELGANDYVNKPFKKYELLARITTQLKLTQNARQIIKINDELKQKTLELEEVNQELELYNDMVSHDIKNPLTAMKAFASILQHKYKDKLEDKGINYLKDIELLSNRIQSIVDNMSVLSTIKPNQIQLQKIDLSLIVREIFAELQYNNPDNNIKIIIPSQVIVEGDENLLWIALENLLKNACKFSVNQTEKTPEIEFGFIQNAQLKLLSKPSSVKSQTVYFVKDNGIGFDMENAELIFNFFKRLHSQDKYEGSGIGLGIVKRIIKYHGGEIWCEAKPNQGATFYFTLNGCS